MKKQAGIADHLRSLCPSLYLSKNSLTLMILGSVTEDSKKSLSPVKTRGISILLARAAGKD
ncbi:hypothetical protein [Clostridium vitabionis]|jgi:hypothetical protein|uniref:hypothetical protein n=1 Tax=Clostridium vitabionis TaxID=2784388 RepID=UPI00188C6919|nr:hypothetical protein [Clostridium vitabionis]